MQTRGAQKGFEPLVPPRCQALVLGSYPSPKSFERNFYYSHPQNRFWPLLAALAGAAPPALEEEKRALIRAGRLALWDCLERCRITGASDASITDPVPCDVAGLVRQKGIQVIFCNGAAAHRLYTRFHLPLTGIEALRLPSTSPANAGYGFEKLLLAWAPVGAYLRPPF